MENAECRQASATQANTATSAVTTSPADTGPQDVAIALAVIHATHHLSNARTRWDYRRKNGLNDEALARCITTELGVWRSYTDAEISYVTKGDDKPTITLMNYKGAPREMKPVKLVGKKLLETCRVILAIPHFTDPTKQLTLFEDHAK
jgi:hypothetical protein